MFDIAWTEMLVIAVIMIVVVGPKDLPRMLRTFGKFTAKMSSMAGDFRKQFDDALKEAELDDVRKSVSDLRSLNPKNEIRKALSPVEKAAADVRSGMDTIMRPKPPTTAASSEATASEPLKTHGDAAAGSDAATAEVASAVNPAPQADEPMAPAAPLAATTPLAEPVKKPRAARAPKAAGANASNGPKPAQTASVKTSAPKSTSTKSSVAKTSANGTAVDKPVRVRKPKETGTAS